MFVHVCSHQPPELWKKLCLRSFPLAVEKYEAEDALEPDSWKELFFVSLYLPHEWKTPRPLLPRKVFREQENLRLEEAINRLRSRREEQVELKKEKEVKLTDRQPPSKRTRCRCSCN